MTELPKDDEIYFPTCITLRNLFYDFAKEGIYALSGNGFAGSVLPMQIIMPTLLLIGITNVIGIQIMVPMGKEKHVLFRKLQVLLWTLR